MKRCSKCHLEKDLSEFRKHKGTKDGRQYQCKACQSAYYYANENYRRVSREGTQRRRRERQEIVNEFKRQGCRVCGYDRCTAAIDCHHVGVKDSLVPKLIERRAPLVEIHAELEKCIPLCSRCHRELHAGFISL